MAQLTNLFLRETLWSKSKGRNISGCCYFRVRQPSTERIMADAICFSGTGRIGREEVKGEGKPQPVGSGPWKFLFVAGLAVLLLEWYIYNRRVSV
jgi:hypothetical protein